MRTLLNTFPTWLLAVLLIGGTTALSVGGLMLVRKRFPDLQARGVNDVAGIVIGVLAAIFGLILGFVTVSLYDDFTNTQGTVQDEATELIQLYEDSRAFPPDRAARVQVEIKSYIAAVRFREWERMRDGQSDPIVGTKHIGDLYGVLRDYEPRTAAQTAFYGDAVQRLNEVVAARRKRLAAAAQELPGSFRAMLFVGALLMIASLYVLGVGDRRLHTILVTSVAVLTSFNLLIVIALDHPFSGGISVSNAPFNQERLQQLHVTPADLTTR